VTKIRGGTFAEADFYLGLVRAIFISRRSLRLMRLPEIITGSRQQHRVVNAPRRGTGTRAKRITRYGRHYRAEGRTIRLTIGI
jgi:hypothetical protein